MTRKKKLFLNSSISLIYQITAFICGFILPRLFLTYYGSEVNGLISSITNFLGFITLAELGVGAVVQAAFYKPLADRDYTEISKVFASSEKFFHIVAYILVAYTAILFVCYPLIVNSSFDYWYTSILIFVMSISYFAQYYLGMSYRLLLTADQLGFIQYGTSTLTLIINTIISVLLVRARCTIHVVKLFSSIIHLVQPFIFRYCVNKLYQIDRKIILTEEPIKQKWNGLAQHIAYVILGNTDVVLLTLFSSLKNVSIYNIYFLVVNGIRQLVVSVTNGFTSLFGNMIAKQESKELSSLFGMVEWVMHTGTTYVFTLCGILIVPFVMLYTDGVKDTDYRVPLFAALLTLSQAVRCIQLPYNTLIHAAGHFKQTQMSSIVEAGLNIIISVALISKLGLVGVALGTIIAVFYRACYLTWYLEKNIVMRTIWYFVLHIIVDVLSLAVFVFLAGRINYKIDSYIDWIQAAVIYGLVGIVVFSLISVIFYPKEIKRFVNILAANQDKKL